MVKVFRYAVVVVSLLALLFLGTTSWLLYSPSGSRWMLNRLPTWAGIELSIGTIKGTLGKALQLDDIELRHQDLRLQLDHFSMHNQLSSLLHLTLKINQLRVERLQIKSTTAQKKKSIEAFHWPKTPWLLGLFDADFSDFEMHDFSWQQQDQQPLLIELFRGNLRWRNGKLKSRKFVLKTAELQGSGSFSIGLKRPLLQLDAQVDTLDSAAAWRQLQMKIDLKPGAAEEILHGSATLGITGSEGELLETEAELGLTPERIQFQQLQLSRPNRPGKISAGGTLRFSGSNPELISELKFSTLDLQKETGQPLRLSGKVQIKGNLQEYSGQFDLENHGTDMTNLSLAGDFSGDFERLTLRNLQGEWLSGTLSGQTLINWKDGWLLKAQLSGQEIDTQNLHPQLAGRLNLELQADLGVSSEESPYGSLQLTLHDSILHDQPMSGTAQVQVQDNAVQIKQLQLHGAGIQVQASGNLAEKLDFNWKIEQLGQLLTDATGQCSGNGWLRWHEKKLAVNLHSNAEKLSFQEWRLDTLNLQAETEDAAGQWHLQLAGQMMHNQPRGVEFEQIKTEIIGSLNDQQLALSLKQQLSSISAHLSGGWDGQQWRGELSSFEGVDSRIGHWHLLQAAPIALSSNQLSIDLFALSNNNGSKLQLQADYHLKQRQGNANVRWQKLDLSLLRPVLSDWLISGESSGSLDLEQGQSNRIHGEITASGEIQRQELQLQLSNSKIQLDWNEQGLQSTLQIILANGGNLHGTLTSSQIADFTLPQKGDLQLTGSDFPLKMLTPWLPPELNIGGALDWNASGHWQADQLLKLQGMATTKTGLSSWQDDGGIITADIDAAELSWQWQNRLQGKLDVQLREQGSIEAAFSLPLPARLPLVFDQTTAINADLHAFLQERGLLSIFFPNHVQESQGQLNLDLQLTGNWLQPHLHGNFHLYDAGIFLPSVGVQLKEIELQGDFSENRIKLATLQLGSGKGKLNGSGQLVLQNWRPEGYSLQLKGENFQLINLPELQVNSNPELKIYGTEENVKVRGQIEFPKVLISGEQKTTRATNSPDLLVVDRESPPRHQSKIKHDIDLKLILGKQVLLNTAGIDARLEGNLRLQSDVRQELVGNGEIRIAKGKYSNYGVSLEISRGNLLFTGGPLDQPTLDILALRKAGEVEAGVKVTGTPKAPIVQLYSEPVMAETDILSYIVIGRPIGTESGQTDLLMLAAGALLSQGESVMLQEKLKNRFGLDVLDLSNTDGDVDSSIITTGKYLSPDLYLSFGYSLFNNTNEVKVRYSITPTWEVESSLGTDSGIDMYYRIEIE